MDVFSDIINTQKELRWLRWEYWVNEVFLTWQWLFLIFSVCFTIFIFVKLVDRTKLTKVLLVGTSSLMIVTFLDVLGAELVLWDYPTMVVPWGSRLICVDIIISIIFMLIYQFFPNWKKYVIASLIVSAIFSFILEKVAIWMEIYHPFAWKSIYSFPIYCLLLITIKWVVDRVYSLENTK
ncbi:CBO0543 family protein [Aquibacillus kalidii]|uniref:CBO0543 family protein n=1 Tax=Aquibacillus kalidii TaxID=2762597 RepID=UPI001646F0D9|nr:CBO0543 family protein [Aquibacillus kalidii]